ncbi:dihydropyrimidinase [Dendrosporobacter sp. 1207_IL3150]|uniref:dihydropyrimidinase n=1 Tax=Dendrosporobacter sp. 1207_IL3150 TaxID=3084054 RepID=UPI002FD9F155
MAIVLTEGTIVTASDCYQADLRIDNGRIAAIGVDIVRPGDEIINVGGCFIFPGGIDPHTHFDLSVGFTRTADDFASGTAAAAAGGTTTIIDFATQDKGGSLRDALSEWHKKADGNSFVDYGFHLAICDLRPSVVAEMDEVIGQGVSSFKFYMAYKDILQVEDGVLLAAMKAAKNNNGLICLHCENGDVIASLVKESIAGGKSAPRYHSVTRPAILECEAVNRALCLARLAQIPLYIVHVSSADALEVIERAKAKGLPVYAETGTQYLLLDEACYQSDDLTAAKFVMSPPLRSAEDKEALWRGLRNGMLSTIASDHCSFNLAGQKDLGINDFSKIPNGAPGVEDRFGLMYSYGVATGLLTLNEFVAVCSTNAAKIFGLYPFKGTIAVGSDADIVVWDPQVKRTITAQDQVQRVDYNAYEGFAQQGSARFVFLRGKLIAESGRLSAGMPTGQYIKRNIFRGG